MIDYLVFFYLSNKIYRLVWSTMTYDSNNKFWNYVMTFILLNIYIYESFAE